MTSTATSTWSTGAFRAGSSALPTARAIGAAAEPFTLWGLFRPETAAALTTIGLDPQVSYLAVRAAPLGAAAPAVVVAAFRSLPAAPIKATLPAVWKAIAPGQMVTLTHDTVSAACRATLASSPLNADVGHIADLLQPIVATLDTTGRPLAAGGQAVALPEEPWARTWRLLTTLREYRGDGHIAALVTADLDLVQTEVLMAAWAGTHLDVAGLRKTRAITDEAWDTATEQLTQRGLLNDDTSISPAGRELRNHLEHLTDLASSPAWTATDPVAVDAIYTFTRAASTALIDSKQIPASTPVGMVWPPPVLTART